MSADLNLELLRPFGTAILIGALVGLDREKRKEEGEANFGGIRTFILLALIGALAAHVGRVLGSPAVFLVTLGVAGLALVIVHAGENLRRSPAAVGLTSEVAALVVLLLGGLCVLGHLELAVALGVVTSVVLTFKQPIHDLVRKVGTDDLYAALKLLVATFVILPVLPRRAVDPWGAINPYTLWLLVILISALSLAGYVATRVLGPRRGLLATGLAGGLVSSTAVTLALARRSRDPDSPPAEARLLGAGILLAWLIMVGRVGVLLWVTDAALARHSLAALGVVALVTGGTAAALVRVPVRDATPPVPQVPLPIKNPFRLTSAIQFAALFAAVLWLVKLAQHLGGGTGSLYLVAVLAGIPDMDAVTLTLADFARSGGPVETAARGVLLALASNTLAKTGLVLGVGDAALRRPILLGAGGVLAATAGAWFLV